MTDNTTFYALGIQGNYLKKTTLATSTLPPSSYKTSFDIWPPLKILSLQCRQINKVKNELDGQPSSLLTSMHARFSAAHLVFLELEDMHQHLNFKILHENSNKVISRSFYLQLLTLFPLGGGAQSARTTFNFLSSWQFFEFFLDFLEFLKFILIFDFNWKNSKNLKKCWAGSISQTWPKNEKKNFF